MVNDGADRSCYQGSLPAASHRPNSGRSDWSPDSEYLVVSDSGDRLLQLGVQVDKLGFPGVQFCQFRDRRYKLLLDSPGERLLSLD